MSWVPPKIKAIKKRSEKMGKADVTVPLGRVVVRVLKTEINKQGEWCSFFVDLESLAGWAFP
jgi:hypothetical protein